MQAVILALSGLLAFAPAAAADDETSQPEQTPPQTAPAPPPAQMAQPPAGASGRQEVRRQRQGRRRAPQRDAKALEVLDQVLQASGGEDYLRSIRSLFVRTRQVTGQGSEARLIVVTEYWKHPNLYRREMETELGLSVMAFNGRYGWHDLAETGDGVTVAPRANNRYFDDLVRDINEPLSHIDELNELSYEGAKELDGRKVEVIRVTRPSGKIKTLYVDTDTHRVVQKEVSRYDAPDKVIARRRYSDFRQVDRLWIPFLEEDLSSDRPARVEVIDFIPNQAIDDGVFDSPLPTMDEDQTR